MTVVKLIRAGEQPPRAARIAVVGAGVSGVLTAIHLLWRCRRDERVYLVEKSGRIGPGVAYATRHPNHLVNVRAENMSAFDDEPDHFVRWLERQPPAVRGNAGRRTIAGLFVRREVYGRYIQDLLTSAVVEQGGSQNLYIVADEATALRPAGGGALQIETGLGRAYEVDAAVLALGNFPPPDPEIPGYVANPWDPKALQGLDPALPVMILGTGLTMVDVVLMLTHQGFAGPILALSRRGLLPRAHGPSQPWGGLRLTADDRRSLRALARAVRREAARADALGVDWRAVIDALRPQVQRLWGELTPADRHRFIRHLRPWWDVHRHRMAPPVAAAIEDARRQGRLQVLTGQLCGIRPGAGTLHLRWRPRGGNIVEERQVQRVIDCRGPGADFRQLPDPLVRQLLADGLVRPDPYRLGLDVAAPGMLVGAHGAPSPLLFGVGPLTRGTFWEITAMPDIRRQAETVAVNALAAARRAVAQAA